MVLAHQPKRQETAHDKKRRGSHHKASRHYGKAYWPYLPMLLIVGAGFMVNVFWHRAGSVLGTGTSLNQSALLQATNMQRTGANREALALNSQLARAAQEKANDMAARDYWSHATPEGTQPWQLVSATGYRYSAAGENLAYGFATGTDTVAGWMNSPSHKANLLSLEYQDVGFGVAEAPNYRGAGAQTIVVALYAAPQPVAAATHANSPHAAQTLAAYDHTGAYVPESVSRIDILTSGSARWLVLGGVALIALAAISLVYRHGKLWRRYLVRGEHFVIRHPLVDTVVVFVVVSGVVLTRTTGFIQ